MKPGRGWRATTLGSLVGIGLLLGMPLLAAADSVTLTWQRNTEADLAGYKIHIGSSPRAYTQTIDVGHVTTFGVSGLSPGQTYFFSITAYDIFANESGYSAELSATIPGTSTPPPPSLRHYPLRRPWLPHRRLPPPRRLTLVRPRVWAGGVQVVLPMAAEAARLGC